MVRMYDNINMDFILRYNMPTSTLEQRLMAGHCEHGNVNLVAKTHDISFLCHS
jgi:hypothetical protein